MELSLYCAFAAYLTCDVCRTIFHPKPALLHFLLLAGLPEGQLCRYCFLRADFPIFRPAAATCYTDQGKIWQGGAYHSSAPSCQISPWSAQKCGFTAPKTLQNGILPMVAHKGRVPCTIFTKFTVFMRVISLHISAKFCCLISINYEIINNLPRWGHFQSNFRWP